MKSLSKRRIHFLSNDDQNKLSYFSLFLSVILLLSEVNERIF